jgi:cell wall-associated NlpC family hydrolase
MMTATIGTEIGWSIADFLASNSTPVPRRDALRAGDLLYFAEHAGGPARHIGIYMPRAWLIHAPEPGRPVTIDPLTAVLAGMTLSEVRRTGADGAMLVLAAEGWLGVPYALGGTSRSGVDCYGLVLCALAELLEV